MRMNELIHIQYEVEQYEITIFIGQNAQISASAYGSTKNLKQCLMNSTYSKSVIVSSHRCF